MKRRSKAPAAKVNAPPIGVVDAVPAAQKLPKIDEVTALAVTARFWDHYPDLQAQLRSTIAGLTSEAVSQLDRDARTNEVVTNPREIRGVIATACHRTLAVVLLGMGESIVEARDTDNASVRSQDESAAPLSDPLSEPQEGA